MTPHERHRSFRSVMGRFATGVVLVTAQTPEGPVGMSVNSFASISLEPPLVSFGVARDSRTWAALRKHRSMAVTILRASHEDLSRVFASKGVDRFSGFEWDRTPAGHPIVPDCLAWVDCVFEAVHEAGDHELVVARALEWSDPRPGDPLVFFGGRYSRLDPRLTVR